MKIVLGVMLMEICSVFFGTFLVDAFDKTLMPYLPLAIISLIGIFASSVYFF